MSRRKERTVLISDGTLYDYADETLEEEMEVIFDAFEECEMDEDQRALLYTSLQLMVEDTITIMLRKILGEWE